MMATGWPCRPGPADMDAPSDNFETWLTGYREVRAAVARRIDEETLVPLLRRLAWKLAFACERIDPEGLSPALRDFELSVLQKLIQEMNAFVECAYGGSTFGTMSAARAALETAALTKHVLADAACREDRLNDWQQYYATAHEGKRWYKPKIIELVGALSPDESAVTMYKATSKAVHLSPLSKRLTQGVKLFHYDEEKRYSREAANFAKSIVTILECLPCRGEALLKEVSGELVDLVAAVTDGAKQLREGPRVVYKAHKG